MVKLRRPLGNSSGAGDICFCLSFFISLFVFLKSPVLLCLNARQLSSFGERRKKKKWNYPEKSDR